MTQGTPHEQFSWLAELAQRIPAHSFMAGLFVYFLLVVFPEREAWYWAQLEKQRQIVLALHDQYQARNDRHIEKLEALILERCSKHAERNH
jgi:hypothetical protein